MTKEMQKIREHIKNKIGEAQRCTELCRAVQGRIFTVLAFEPQSLNTFSVSVRLGAEETNDSKKKSAVWLHDLNCMSYDTCKLPYRPQVLLFGSELLHVARRGAVIPWDTFVELFPRAVAA